MTTEGPPPGYRTLSQLISAAADQKCAYCKAEPQVPCTWPTDKYHVARFNGIGVTEFERHSVEAATRPDLGHTRPTGYLVDELPPYRPEPTAEPRPEPEPELEAG